MPASANEWVRAAVAELSDTGKVPASAQARWETRSNTTHNPPSPRACWAATSLRHPKRCREIDS